MEGRAEETRSGEPDDGQLLAALRRAMRHRRPRPGPAPMWELLEHLEIPRRSGAARRLRARLGRLEAEGLVARGREHGLPVWSLTPAGARALARGGDPALPESPRRRAWRAARAAAAQELPRFRARLAAALGEAERMLEGAGVPGGASSEDWLAAGRRLESGCRRIASARHCLYEWREPGDEAPAVESAPEAALRNVRLWREPD